MQTITTICSILANSLSQALSPPSFATRIRSFPAPVNCIGITLPNEYCESAPTFLSTRLRLNTIRQGFVVFETEIDALPLPRHYYSIIGRPIQSLLSQRTAKSGCLSPCKRARAS
jgi:hypothetical protein